MGIPYAFQYYYKKYNCENELMIDFNKLALLNINYLFFDYNSLIHPCAQQILSANNDKYILIEDSKDRTKIIEDDIIENCLNYTRLLINQILQTKQKSEIRHVYITIDGVAPRSKMNQQRERRYKSEFFKIGEKSSLWDSNKITPGTSFMNKIKDSLINFAKEIKNSIDINCIISDSDDVGEGEHKIMKIITTLKDDNEDSVTGNTPLLLQDIDGNIEIQTIENLTNNWRVEDGKEYGYTTYKVWSDNGWIDISNIVRHKVKKNIYRILTNTGCVDVTEDHSLLNINKECVKPINCKLGDSLLHSFPSFIENKIIIPNNIDTYHRDDIYKLASLCKIKQYQKFKKGVLINKLEDVYKSDIFINLDKSTDITLSEAYIMGLWWADGSCGIYNYKNTKNKAKDSDVYHYQWYISNCDLILLNNVKNIIENIYNISSTIFEDKYHNTKKNRQKSYKLKINGGKSIKSLIDKYINMFYYKNKDSKYVNGNKYISSSILNSPKNIREEFLKGYYHGDGTGHDLNVIRKSMDVESKISAQSIYYLCRSLGYEVSLNIRDDKPSVYKLIITKNYQTKDKNTIKKIKNMGISEEYVYDLQTSNGHFQAGIGQLIVHNSNISNNKKHKCLIYGLDADLIMLSLMNKNYDKIILIRDNSFNNNLSENKKVIDYLNIKKLKRYICDDISGLLTKYKQVDTKNIDSENLIYDYIVICFLLGNDFLEHIPSLSIKKNGIDIIMRAYISAWKGHYLINKSCISDKINWYSSINLLYLKDIMYNLKNSEVYFFKNFKLDKLVLSEVTNYETLSQNNNINFYKDDVIRFHEDDNYKSRYYMYYGIKSNNIDKLCLNYIEGLYWIFGYYNNHIHQNWTWFFEYHNSPFCSDIFEFLRKTPFDNIIDYMRKSDKLKESKSYNPLKQLYMVLPKSSLKNILTDMDYNTDSLEYSLFLYDKFYPNKLSVDIYNKKYLWQTKIFFENINENIIDLFLT
jgi:hypothetical protein